MARVCCRSFVIPDGAQRAPIRNLEIVWHPNVSSRVSGFDASHRTGMTGHLPARLLPLHCLPADVAAAETFRPADAINRLIGASLRLGNSLA